LTEVFGLMIMTAKPVFFKAFQRPDSGP